MISFFTAIGLFAAGMMAVVALLLFAIWLDGKDD